MWFTKSDNGFYTVHYCYKCKCQRTMHSIARDLYKCDVCGLKLRYDYQKDRLTLY